MAVIEIDFDVYKALTLRRPTEEVTYSDILREVLGLSQAKNYRPNGVLPSTGEWVSKGVRFPSGTEFRATYKGETYHGKVEAGALLVNGKRFDSPSAAAVSITENPVNGWTFWECRFPGQSRWRMIKAFRK
jgi:hypothetical protein